jgi:hypothetical protein
MQKTLPVVNIDGILDPFRTHIGDRDAMFFVISVPYF